MLFCWSSPAEGTGWYPGCDFIDNHPWYPSHTCQSIPASSPKSLSCATPIPRTIPATRQTQLQLKENIRTNSDAVGTLQITPSQPLLEHISCLVGELGALVGNSGFYNITSERSFSRPLDFGRAIHSDTALGSPRRLSGEYEVSTGLVLSSWRSDRPTSCILDGCIYVNNSIEQKMVSGSRAVVVS